jgi:hypothetical protein
MKANLAVITFATMVASACTVIAALDVTPNFADAPTGWTTDRYQPNSFANVGSFQGRSDVLGIGISSAQGMGNRGGQNTQFYNTQGMQHALTGGAGTKISADLWVPSTWANPANGSVRTDIWGVMSDGTSVTAYPILGFSSYGGASRFRAWDAEVGWIDSAASVLYDEWNTLAIEHTGASFIFSVNGDTVYADATIGATTQFSAVIMQAYNFYGDASLVDAVAVDYTAYWANSAAGVVPEPSTYIAGALLLLPFAVSTVRHLRHNRQA